MKKKGFSNLVIVIALSITRLYFRACLLFDVVYIINILIMWLMSLPITCSFIFVIAAVGSPRLTWFHLSAAVFLMIFWCQFTMFEKGGSSEIPIIFTRSKTFFNNRSEKSGYITRLFRNLWTNLAVGIASIWKPRYDETI